MKKKLILLGLSGLVTSNILEARMWHNDTDTKCHHAHDSKRRSTTGLSIKRDFLEDTIRGINNRINHHEEKIEKLSSPTNKLCQDCQEKIQKLQGKVKEEKARRARKEDELQNVKNRIVIRKQNRNCAD